MIHRLSALSYFNYFTVINLEIYALNEIEVVLYHLEGENRRMSSFNKCIDSIDLSMKFENEVVIEYLELSFH